MAETLEDIIKELFQELQGLQSGMAYEGGVKWTANDDRSVMEDVKSYVARIKQAHLLEMERFDELRRMQGEAHWSYNRARDAYDMFYYVPPSPPWDMRMRSIKSYGLELNEDFRLMAVKAQKHAAEQSLQIRRAMGIEE